MDTPLALIYCPFPTMDSARAAAKQLIEAKLAACCNLLPAGESHYQWQGSYQTTEEVVLLAKTTPQMAQNVADYLAQSHPYDCPAILTLPATATPAFAAWATASVKDC